jgi:hypothetical protein
MLVCAVCIGHCDMHCVFVAVAKAEVCLFAFSPASWRIHPSVLLQSLDLVHLLHFRERC